MSTDGTDNNTTTTTTATVVCLRRLQDSLMPCARLAAFKHCRRVIPDMKDTEKKYCEAWPSLLPLPPPAPPPPPYGATQNDIDWYIYTYIQDISTFHIFIHCDFLPLSFYMNFVILRSLHDVFYTGIERKSCSFIRKKTHCALCSFWFCPTGAIANLELIAILQPIPSDSFSSDAAFYSLENYSKMKPTAKKELVIVIYLLK